MFWPFNGWNRTETLRFFSAIERGLVLRLAQGTDLVAHLDRALGGLSAGGVTPDILACDCILRRLEAEKYPNRARGCRMCWTGMV